jgi:hypothetical protein
MTGKKMYCAVSKQIRPGSQFNVKPLVANVITYCTVKFNYYTIFGANQLPTGSLSVLMY